MAAAPLRVVLGILLTTLATNGMQLQSNNKLPYRLVSLSHHDNNFTAFLESEIMAFLGGHRRHSLTRLQVILLMNSGSGLNNGSISPNESTRDAMIGIKAFDLSASDRITSSLLIELLPSREPYVSIEIAPSNARRIFTGVDIMADMESIWEVLTAFDNLQDVVPSLVKNEVLFRTPEGGARLAQVGGAKVLPGVTFTAKTVLDVSIFKEDSPMPSSMLTNRADRMPSLIRGVYPCPDCVLTLPHRDIAIQNVLGEGDFEHYQGVWRMQSLPNFTPHGGRVSRLTYAVEIKPKGFLPVNLIEGRIATDLKANLAAIRDYVENIAQRLREETAALKAMKEEETIASQTAMLMECSPDTLNVVNEDMTLVGTISSLEECRSDAEQNFVEPTIDSKSSRTSSHLIEEDQSQRVSRAAIDVDLTRDKAQLMRENEGIRRVVQAMEMDLGDVLSRIREIRSLTKSQLDQEAASA